MSNFRITVARFSTSGKKAVMHTVYDSPGFPSAVTDDKGNTYTRHSETREDALWYTTTDDYAPTRATFTYHDGRTDSFYLE